MTSGPDFLADAADDLVAAANRFQRERRTHKRVATGVAAALVVATGALIAHGAARSDEASAEHVTITPGGDGFQVVTIDETAPAAEIIDDLQRAGIAVDRVDVPVGPSRVGEALNTSSSGAQIGAGIYQVPTGTAVRVEVGVRAAPGADYRQPSDAFGVGEPLHCSGQRGGDALALAERIPAGVTVEWFRGITNDSPITPNDLVGTKVYLATASNADSVRINVVEGTGPTEPPAC